LQNIALYYIALQFNRVQLGAIQYNVAPLSAVCRHAVPCNAMLSMWCQTNTARHFFTDRDNHRGSMGTTQEQLAQLRTVLETFDKQN